MMKISNYIALILKQQLDTYLVSISISLENFKSLLQFAVIREWKMATCFLKKLGVICKRAA
jgi:hypothetical protein